MFKLDAADVLCDLCVGLCMMYMYLIYACNTLTSQYNLSVKTWHTLLQDTLVDFCSNYVHQLVQQLASSMSSNTAQIKHHGVCNM